MLRLLTCDRGHFWETGEERCPQCGAPADTLPVLEPQTPEPAGPPPTDEVELLDASDQPVVAGYDILEDLGRGPTGMRLYKAKQRSVSRMVLLEVVLAKEDPSQHAWSSLRSQAAALARLAHPGVMQLWEVGERDRQLFFNACEYVEGPTLTQKVASKPLPVAQAVRLVEMLARTIDHAHASSVLHRNLRPDAVRLQPTQMPLKLPDRENQPGAAVFLHSAAFLPRLDGFGLVRRPVEGETTDAELYGEQIGFLSPEQAWGRVQELGNATDVWGLGAILFFLLSGEPPYRGDNRAAVLDLIQTGEPQWRRMRRGGDDLEAVVRKAMARTPSRRYTSAGALADDLRRLLLSLPLSIREGSPGYLFGKWLRRRPAVAALLVMTALGGIGTLGGFVAGYLSSAATTREVTTLRNQVNNLNSQLTYTNLQMNDLRRQAGFGSYVRKLAQARQQIADGKPLPARGTLDTIEHVHRGFEWYLAHEQTSGGGKVELPAFDGGIKAAALDPSGRTVLVATPLPGKEKMDRVVVWHVQTRNQTRTLDDFVGTIRALAVSPAGDTVAAAGASDVAGGQVKVWFVGEGPQRGSARFTQRVGDKPLTAVAYNSLGMLAVAAQTDTAVTVIAPNGQPVPRAGPTMMGDVVPPKSWALSWIGPNQLVAGPILGNRLVLSDATVGARSTPGNLGGNLLLALAASPETERVACALSNGTVRVMRGLLAQGADLGPLPTPALRLAFSSDPDHLRLAAAHGDKVTVFALNGEDWVEVVTLDADGTRGLAFGPGGRTLLTAGAKGAAVWGKVNAP